MTGRTTKRDRRKWLLSLWRKLPPSTLELHHHERLVNALADELSRSSSPDVARLAAGLVGAGSSSLARQGSALALVGDVALHVDLRGPLLAVAALAGSGMAARLLAFELWQLSAAACAPVERRRLARLALAWARHVHERDVGHALREAGAAWRRRQEARQALEKGAADAAVPAAGRTGEAEAVIVLRDLEDRPDTRPYRRLLEPLRLVRVTGPLAPVAAALTSELPWAADAIEALLDDLRLRRRGGIGAVRFRPTLLLGPPGSGKSHLVNRLVALLGLRSATLGCAGMSDSRTLAGTPRGWAGSGPSLPTLAMLRAGVANPALILDEVDKATSTHNGSLHAALLPMLEPATARAYYDEGLSAAIDLSHVSFLGTANTLRGLPAPLLSRLRVLEVPPPRPEDAPGLLTALRRALAAELGVGAADLPPLAPEAEAALARAFARQRDVRALTRGLAAALAVGSRGPWVRRWH